MRWQGEKRNEMEEAEDEGTRDERERTTQASIGGVARKVNVPFAARAARYSRMPHWYLHQFVVLLVLFSGNFALMRREERPCSRSLFSLEQIFYKNCNIHFDICKEQDLLLL